MPNFVVAQVPDAAELERMLVGVAEASAGTPEERGAVVALIRAAFKREMRNGFARRNEASPRRLPLPQPGGSYQRPNRRKTNCRASRLPNGLESVNIEYDALTMRLPEAP